MLFIDKEYGQWTRVHHAGSGADLFVTATMLMGRVARMHFLDEAGAYLVESPGVAIWKIQETRRVVHASGDHFTLKLITARHDRPEFTLGAENPLKAFDFVHRWNGVGIWPDARSARVAGLSRGDEAARRLARHLKSR